MLEPLRNDFFIPMPFPATASLWSGRHYEPCNVTSQWLLLNLLYNSGFHCSSTHHQPGQQVASHFFLQGKHFPPLNKTSQISSTVMNLNLAPTKKKPNKNSKKSGETWFFTWFLQILHHIFFSQSNTSPTPMNPEALQPTNQPNPHNSQLLLQGDGFRCQGSTTKISQFHDFWLSKK